MELIIKTAGIVSLIGLMSLLLYCYISGRRIVRYFKKHYPTFWEELGKPKPDYFSPITYMNWTQFLKKDGFREKTDTTLESMRRKQYRIEQLLFYLTLGFFFIFGILAYWFTQIQS